MKKITILFSLLMASISYSQTIINFDATNFADGTGGLGYMNVFDNPKNGSVGGYQFGNGWGIPDLISLVDTGLNTVELKPNRIGDTDIYWQTPGELEGNKLMEANHFVEDASLRGTNFSFTGTVETNTLNSTGLSFAFQPVVFIKVFSSTFTLLDSSVLPIPASGDFVVTMDATTYNTDEVIQYGFQMLGPNISTDSSFDADYNNLGSIVVKPATLSNTDLKLSELEVFPNPTNSVWNLRNENQIIETVAVYDLLGKQVLNILANKKEVVIDASVLNDGVYLAKITTGTGNKTIKLVKN